MSVERHPGSFDIVTVKDADNNTFATRYENIFSVAKSDGKFLVSMPKGRGVAATILQEQQARAAASAQ